MPLPYPDSLENANSDYKLIDDTELKGGAIALPNKTARNAIPLDKRKQFMIVSYNDSGAVTMRYKSANLTNTEWVKDTNWETVGLGISTDTNNAASIGSDGQIMVEQGVGSGLDADLIRGVNSDYYRGLFPSTTTTSPNELDIGAAMVSHADCPASGYWYITTNKYIGDAESNRRRYQIAVRYDTPTSNDQAMWFRTSYDNVTETPAEIVYKDWKRIVFSSDLASYVPYTGATSDVDLGSNNITAKRFISTQATGTAPLVVVSTTKVANLNAEKVNNHTVEKDVPAGAVFTDTQNVINNTLTSTSTNQSLSANQGKVLNDKITPNTAHRNVTSGNPHGTSFEDLDNIPSHLLPNKYLITRDTNCNDTGYTIATMTNDCSTTSPSREKLELRILTRLELNISGAKITFSDTNNNFTLSADTDVSFQYDVDLKLSSSISNQKECLIYLYNETTSTVVTKTISMVMLENRDFTPYIQNVTRRAEVLALRAGTYSLRVTPMKGATGLIVKQFATNISIQTL